MSNSMKFNKDQSGQAALETAIILIAFVVVASVFAFAILSAGSASTDKGKQAINNGLAGVQSSMSIKGAVNADAASTTVDHVVFDVALVAGGTPVDLTNKSGASSKNVVVINYADSSQSSVDLPWTVKFIGNNNGDNLLQEGELAEITVDLTGLTTKLPASTPFSLEVKPPTGAVMKIDRTTPPAIAKFMSLD